MCLFGAVQAQTDDGTYKLANFQETDVPKVHDASLEKIKTFSGSLWDAAWKDYEATQARLDAEQVQGKETADAGPADLMQVDLEGEPAWIPNLEYLESLGVQALRPA